MTTSTASNGQFDIRANPESTLNSVVKMTKRLMSEPRSFDDEQINLAYWNVGMIVEQFGKHYRELKRRQFTTTTGRRMSLGAALERELDFAKVALKVIVNEREIDVTERPWCPCCVEQELDEILGS